MVDRKKRIALIGRPNTGKSALFNRLTGVHQHIANYAGVTVEAYVGRTELPKSGYVDVIDLPGLYSLHADTPDARTTLDIFNTDEDEKPDLVICMIDATALAFHLPMIQEAASLGVPMIIAVNKSDLARRDGLEVDIDALCRALQIPVVAMVAVRNSGIVELRRTVDAALQQSLQPPKKPFANDCDIRKETKRLAKSVVTITSQRKQWTDRLDNWLLHPVMGYAFLLLSLFVVFQSVFSWSEMPIAGIEFVVNKVYDFSHRQLASNRLLQKIVCDALITGVGSVIVFLPQILILFFWIGMMELSGYMARCAWLMDRLMKPVGLSGRSFIPLLSSYACAIPGIMATRTLERPQDRIITILMAPLMTCSARLPVYTLLITVFIPDQVIIWPFNLRGLVLFVLYASGILFAWGVGFVLRRGFFWEGDPSLLMEMPRYQWPQIHTVVIELMHRGLLFLKRAGTIILAVVVLLWFLSHMGPGVWIPDPDMPLRESIAGLLGGALHQLLAPLGFSLEISLALIPGIAAREAVIGALASIYTTPGGGESGLSVLLEHEWSLPVALSFLAWYVVAPQCISTYAIMRHELGGHRWPMFYFLALFALAWIFAWIVYKSSIMILGF